MEPSTIKNSSSNDEEATKDTHTLPVRPVRYESHSLLGELVSKEQFSQYEHYIHKNSIWLMINLWEKHIVYISLYDKATIIALKKRIRKVIGLSCCAFVQFSLMIYHHIYVYVCWYWMIDLALLFDDAAAVHGNPIWQQQQQGWGDDTAAAAEGKKILRMVARQNYHTYIHWTHKILSFYCKLPSPFLTHWLCSLTLTVTSCL